MTTATRTAGRLFITTSQAVAAARVLRSAAGTITAHGSEPTVVVDAIQLAAAQIAPDAWAVTAMHARSALLGWLDVDLKPYGGYTMPAIAAWQKQATVVARVNGLTSAADRLLATIDAYRYGATA